MFYVSDYGYSDRLSQSIASGITKTGVSVEMIDLRSADAQEVQELIGRCAGIVIGMPPTTEMLPQPRQISTALAAAKEKQVVGMFESGGGDDEPVDPLLSNFRDLGLTVVSGNSIKETPTETTYKLCEEAGTDTTMLTRESNIKQIKSLDTNLESPGRISGGLYIITAKR